MQKDTPIHALIHVSSSSQLIGSSVPVPARVRMKNNPFALNKCVYLTSH